MAGSVLAVSCRALASVCDAHGVATDALLSAAGISRRVLDDPDGRVSPDALVTFWETGYERLSDPALALHVAESLPRGAYRVIEFLASHSATVGEAFEKLVRYFGVIDDTTELVIEEHPGTWCFGPATTDPGVPLPAIEFLLAASYLRIREMTGVDFSPMRLELAAVETAYAQELARVFRCPVLWRAAAHRLCFSPSTWQTPTSRADPALLSVLEDHARALREKHPTRPGFVDRLIAVIEETWVHEVPTLANVAKRLGVSSRTLQRRTNNGGRSFALLVDDARRRAALRWLSDPSVSLGEIAFLLHFSDQATFTRAVKRWTGQTPTQVRAVARGVDGSPDRA